MLTWCAFSAVANLLPVPARPHVYLSMSSPVNIAIALVFPASVAAAVVSLGSFSEFEIRRSTTPSRAAYNRMQLGLSTAAASSILHLRPGPQVWTVFAAAACYHVVNWGLVVVAVSSSQGTPIRRVLNEVVPDNPVGIVVYLALGAMGVALGLTGQRVGLWAAAVMLIPLIGARQAVRAAQEIEGAERERRMLGDRLIEERERERLRIAADLHDVVLQDLALLQVQADNVMVAAGRGDSRAVGLSQSLRAQLDGAISDVRAAIENLRRSDIVDEGLAVALERVTASMARRTGLTVSMRATGDLGSVSGAIQLVVYEACRELLTNVTRHARASSVDVSLERTGDQLEVRVTDDGVGVPPEGPAMGQGLSIVRQRIAAWGGDVRFHSAGRGTTVLVSVPMGADSAGD